MKKTTLLLTTMCATLALAASIDGTSGRGRARNGDGVNAVFDFHAAKLTDGDHVRVDGGGFLGLPNEDPLRRAQIFLPHASRLNVNMETKVAEFGGLGTMVRFDREGHRHELRGVVWFRVVDHRDREHPDGHDEIGVRFDAPGTDHDFQYGGVVVDGNINVFHQER